jgi:hypothetical protein
MIRASWLRTLRMALPVVLLAGYLTAQTAPVAGASAVPVITFTFDFPASDPSRYSIAVDSNGHTVYESTVKSEDNSDPENYRVEFAMTPTNRNRIFEWARQAKYFEGKVDSGNRKLAFTGDKILSYQDGERSLTARYNYSNIEPVRQVTMLFQKMAGTLDYGRRLTYDHRYQKLALDDVLKRMEAQAKSDELTEIQSLTPLLQEIVEDNSVINQVRARAKELIEIGGSAVAGR